MISFCFVVAISYISESRDLLDGGRFMGGGHHLSRRSPPTACWLSSDARHCVGLGAGEPLNEYLDSERLQDTRLLAAAPSARCVARESRLGVGLFTCPIVESPT
jgi:hypothetical protein